MSETPAPPSISSREVKPPVSRGTAMPDEPEVIDKGDPIDPIRSHLQPLYDEGSLLGFAVCDADGDLFQNETFLSREGVQKAIDVFRERGAQLGESGRSVHRMSLEMDDVFVIYHGIDAGEGLFILASDCDLDSAAAHIAKLAE